MSFLEKLKRPIKNEDGFAVIIMVAVIIVVVGSYTLYAANYFQVLTTEVKKFKRQIGGLAIMHQVGQKVADMRARHEAVYVGPAFDCTAAGPFSLEHQQLCLRPGPDSNRVCVNNPFGDASAGTDPICINETGGAGDGRTLEVSLTEEQLKNAPSIEEGWIHEMNMFVGEKAIAAMYSIAGEAKAYDDRDRPVLSAQPTLTRATVSCTAGAVDPTRACMQCKKSMAEPPSAGKRPACFRLKICIRPGGCTDADHYFWQIVAVTSPGYGT